MRTVGQPFPCTCPCHQQAADGRHPPDKCPCAPFLDDESIESIDVNEDPDATIQVFVTRHYPTRTA